MPKLDQMPEALVDYAVKTTKVANDILTDSAIAGAQTMRMFIEAGSPTGTKWHKDENKRRNQDEGARMDSKTMLRSVMSQKAKTTPSKILVKFGWQNDGPEGGYFVQQDDGSYRVGGIGMGLLNKAKGRDMIALIAAREEFTSRMRKAGFKESVLF